MNIRSLIPRSLPSLLGAAAFLVLAAPAMPAQAQKTIKISHQFPGGTIDEGDFRDRLVRRFAQEVEKRTNGSLRSTPARR